MSVNQQQINKVKASLEKGFNDMKLVMEEGNAKLFAKQFVVVIVAFLLFRYVNGSFQDKISNYRGQVEAIHSQQSNEQEYLASKKRLLDLEPRFPDLESKSEWLMTQVLDVFKQANLTPKFSGSQTEDTMNPNYTLASLELKTTASWPQFAQLMVGLENRPEYLRLSTFKLSKNADSAQLGTNEIKMTINTLFPKEKLAPKLFKDQGGN